MIVFKLLYFMLPKKKTSYFWVTKNVAINYPLTMHCFSQCKKLDAQYICET